MSTIYNKNYILIIFFFFFFFNDTATTEIYTLSLHDALPISDRLGARLRQSQRAHLALLDEALHRAHRFLDRHVGVRSEEHTSELQSRSDLVCRLLLEKKKKQLCILFANPLSSFRRPLVSIYL